jgi:hypothetical protein
MAAVGIMRAIFGTLFGKLCFLDKDGGCKSSLMSAKAKEITAAARPILACATPSMGQ